MNSSLQERWNARLEAWAEYMMSAEKGGKVKISSAYKLGGRGGGYNDGDGVPIHVGEALDTHAVYLRLPDHLRRAVWVWYCDQGTPGEKAAVLAIHRDTLAGRLIVARERLEDLHRDRQRAKA